MVHRARRMNSSMALVQLPSTKTRGSRHAALWGAVFEAAQPRLVSGLRLFEWNSLKKAGESMGANRAKQTKLGSDGGSSKTPEAQPAQPPQLPCNSVLFARTRNDAFPKDARLRKQMASLWRESHARLASPSPISGCSSLAVPTRGTCFLKNPNGR